MQYVKQEKYTLRKSKKYKNLCSVALGLTVATAIGLASDNQAYASENEVVKTENPATNNKEIKPQETTEADDSKTKENQKINHIEITIDPIQLDQAVEEARNNGLRVEKEADVDLGIATSTEEATRKLEEANQDYKKQAEEVKIIINEYNNKKEEYIQEIERIKQENEALKSDYEKEKQEKETYNQMIEERNRLKKEEYDRKLAENRQKIQEIKEKLQAGDGIRVGLESHATALISPYSGITYEGGSTTWQGNNFTFETVVDDGNGHFETGILSAHLNIDTRYNEADGSSTISILSVTFDSFRTELTRQNTAVAKDHSFNYTDSQGNVIFSINSDGMSEISSIPINKTYRINKTVTLRPGQVSEAVLIAKDIPQWLANSEAYIYATLSYNPNISTPTPLKEPNYELKNEKEITPPKYKDLPLEPTAPSLKYHYNKLSVQPDVHKEVKNTEGTNIDKGLVSKLSTVNWELKTENLPIGRETTTKFVITDNLPTGYEVDLEKTKAASSSFDVVYTKDNHTLVFTALTETLNKLNQDLTKEIEAPFPTIIGKVLNDGAIYKNNFKLEINDYEKYSNTVTISTPGNPNDPDNPTNNLIEPKKENTNKDGVNIDGKTLLPGSINYYKLLWDLDQYKGIKASKEDIAKGFFYIDDYPEEALTPNEKDVTLVDSKGQAVKGVKVEAFESLEKATEEVKAMLKKAGIEPKGAFQLFAATNPEEFFNEYISTGNSITITNPMIVKEAFVGKYENKAYQIDFGNGYETNLVENDTPLLEVDKDVVVTVSTKYKSLDNTEVEVGTVFNYRLVGANIPGNRSDVITNYAFFDDYDQEHDEYNGLYKVFALEDIILKDGTILKKGTDLTQYTTQYLDTQVGTVDISVDKQLLKQVSLDSKFQLEVFLEVKRITSGEVTNKFFNTVNNINLTSDIVKTTTPYKKITELTPKPEPKEPLKKEESKKEATKQLPKTSAVKVKKHNNNNNAETLASGLLTLGVLTLVRKRKI